MVATQPGMMRRYCGRHRSSVPFLGLAIAAILAGGLIAAAVAHDPGRNAVWVVAYLVLVAGLAQAAFGVGQVLLADAPVGSALIAAQFLLFNLGNVGVVGGTLADAFIPVAVGTALFLVALALFRYGSRGSGGGRLRSTYHGLLAVVAVGAVVGLGLSALGNLG